MDAALQARRSAYARLSSMLARMDDHDLRSALSSSAIASGGWGTTYAAEVDGQRVFVKRIPLTDVEASRPWSTRNHFGLPPYYNYGVGSAGFGAFRELVAHITTTGWVLEGATSSFAMLLHHRVLPRTDPQGLDDARLEQYRQRWNGQRSVAEFMRARAEAGQEIWLVLEHVPHGMAGWIMANQDRVVEVIHGLFAAVSLFRRRGMVHFDLHFGNVLTDGEAVYIADFGLLNDPDFDLTDPERRFLEKHRHYDFAEAISSVGLAPMWALWGKSEEERAEILREHEWLRGVTGQSEFAAAVIDNLEKMTVGPLAIGETYAAELHRYRELILYMADFLETQRHNPRKDTPYDDDHVRRLLEDAQAPID